MSSLQKYTEDELEQLQNRDAIAQARQDAYIRKAASRSIRQRQLVHAIGRSYTGRQLDEFTDMMVHCYGGKIFRVHKVIVLAQSVTIRECCREASVNGHHCMLRINCHPLVFQMVIQYLYTCDYTFFLDWNFPTRFLAEGQTVPGDGFDRLDCCELSLHLQVHILAKALRINGLKYLSAHKCNVILCRSAFPTVFPRFVREVYKLLPRRNAFMRQLVVNHAEKVIIGLGPRGHFDERFPRYILREVAEFEHDLRVRIGEEEFLDGEGDLDLQIGGQMWVC
ncbi:hypothetical protein BJX70DRAFT_396614 [Aspergillus crustosus]